MALTKVSRALLSTSIVDNGNATAITIDSSENVGIGTSSPNSYAGQTTLNINSAGVARLDLDIGDTMQGFLLAESGYTGLFTPSGSNSLRFGTNNTERMRIDSSGNVGVGTSSPNVTGYDSNATVQTITGPLRGILELQGSSSAADVMGAINFYSAANLEAAIQSRADSGTFNGNLEFITNGSERMRIDSSGNLLVGKPATGIATVGAELKSTGELLATVNSDACAFLNRKTSDGNIAVFRKDGSTVGSIGTLDGNSIYIGNGDVNLRMIDVTDDIRPVTSTGTNRDAAIDLGDANARFKDLYLSGKVQASYIYRADASGAGLHFTTNAIYPTNDIAALSDGTESLGAAAYRFNNFYLSGGIYLGGTGSANRFDDYEEGTWTPVTGPTSTTATYSYRAGYYTKVGNLVTCTFGLKHSGGVWTGGEANISGLPFAVDTTGPYQEPMFIVTTLGLAPTGQGGSAAGGALNIGEVGFYLSGGETKGRGRQFNTNADTVMGANAVFATTSFIKATIIYHSS